MARRGWWTRELTMVPDGWLDLSPAELLKLAMPKRILPDRCETLSASLGGEASAFGTDTLTTADVTLTVTRTAEATVVCGTATLEAHASGDGAFAVADIAASVEGADIVIMIRTEADSVPTEGAESAASTEALRIFAIDFDAFDFASGPVEIVRTASKPFEPSLDLSGNIATFDVDVEATGENSLADVNVSALTIADILSTVSVDTLAILT